MAKEFYESLRQRKDAGEKLDFESLSPHDLGRLCGKEDVRQEAVGELFGVSTAAVHRKRREFGLLSYQRSINVTYLLMQFADLMHGKKYTQEQTDSVIQEVMAYLEEHGWTQSLVYVLDHLPVTLQILDAA